MSVDEVSRRRRVVYNGLRAFATADEIRQALQLLDKECPPNVNFSVREFLAKLCAAVPSCEPIRGKVFAEMLRLSVLRGDQIGPEPDPDMSKWEAKRSGTMAAPKAVSSMSGSWPSIFDAFLTQLTFHLDSINPKHMNNLANTMKGQLNQFSPSTAGIIRRWCNDPRTLPDTSPLGKPELSTWMHAIYIWACTALGPADADQIFGKVLREIERLPEAARFPPRSLL